VSEYCLFFFPLSFVFFGPFSFFFLYLHFCFLFVATCAVMFIFVNEDGGATDFQEHCFDDSVDGLHPVIATEISNNEAGMSYSILVVKFFI
jgi:hypothetical protein